MRLFQQFIIGKQRFTTAVKGNAPIQHHSDTRAILDHQINVMGNHNHRASLRIQPFYHRQERF